MDFFDFIRQSPSMLIALFIFVGSYLGVIIVVLRARKRRRLTKQRGGQGGNPLPIATPRNKRIVGGPVGNFLSGELPEHSNTPADWTVPSELRDLPEPDLDMLSMPSLDALIDIPSVKGERAQSSPVMNPVVLESESLAPDWLASLADSPDTTMASSDSTSQAQEITAMDSSSSANTDFDPNAPLPADAVEVMRIYRDMNDGHLIIQMGDQRYRSMNDIKNPDLARRFTTIVRSLWAMVGGGPSAAPSGGTFPVANTPSPAAPAESSSSGGMLSRMGLLNTNPEPEKPKQGFMQQFTRATTGQVNKDAAPAGIVGAVEEFLQFKLSNTPQFAMRSIHIRPAADQGIRIEVDNHSYDAIGDIVEADVREFMINMMREWEARH
jgi:hypothetical protein